MAQLGVETECGLSVLALLERVSGVLEGVQNSQARMKDQQGALEEQVAAMREQVTRLGSEHAITAASVQKLLQKSRRVSVHVKEVKTRVDKQNTRVRKVETSQDQLLTRNRFRVVIYQGDTELPSVAVTKVPKGAGLSAVEVEPEEYEPPGDLSSDDEYMTLEEAESTRAERMRAGLRERVLATRQRTRDNLTKTGATLRQGGAALGGRMRGLGQRVVPSDEQRQRIRQSGQRLRQSIAEKAPNIRLRPPPRSVAEGQEGGADATAATVTTPPKGRKRDVTELEREGPVSEERVSVSVPLDGKVAVETGKDEE